MAAAPPSPPLAGMRVIDLSTSYAGPTCSMYLADLGADVIKVEKPGGDDARSWGPPFVDGESAWFASANRGKRSVCLDLRTPDGADALVALIAEADVFLHNLNPAKVERMDLGADRLTELNPRLVYCGISGFGADGPASSLPGYDLAAQARSGLMSVTGTRGGPPQRVSTALSDVVTGMCAALAIAAALVGRGTHGRGDVIDVSLLDSDLALMAPRLASFLAGEPEPAPSGGTDSVLAVYQTFATADRDLVVAIGTDAMWRRFCDAIGLPELGSDPGLAGNAARRARRTELAEKVQEALRTRSSADWLATLAAADVPASIVQSLGEVVIDPQVVARGALLPTPGEERLVGVHAPFRLLSTEPPTVRHHPGLGEHTDEVLAGLPAPETNARGRS
ncbi:CoA transferase [Nocardioides hungaricus]